MPWHLNLNKGKLRRNQMNPSIVLPRKNIALDAPSLIEQLLRITNVQWNFEFILMLPTIGFFSVKGVVSITNIIPNLMSLLLPFLKKTCLSMKKNWLIFFMMSMFLHQPSLRFWPPYAMTTSVPFFPRLCSILTKNANLLLMLPMEFSPLFWMLKRHWVCYSCKYFFVSQCV